MLRPRAERSSARDQCPPAGGSRLVIMAFQIARRASGRWPQAASTPARTIISLISRLRTARGPRVATWAETVRVVPAGTGAPGAEAAPVRAAAGSETPLARSGPAVVQAPARHSARRAPAVRTIMLPSLSAPAAGSAQAPRRGEARNSPLSTVACLARIGYLTYAAKRPAVIFSCVRVNNS